LPYFQIHNASKLRTTLNGLKNGKPISGRKYFKSKPRGLNATAKTDLNDNEDEDGTVDNDYEEVGNSDEHNE
jgi:hypothetical protein